MYYVMTFFISILPRVMRRTLETEYNSDSVYRTNTDESTNGVSSIE